MTTEQEPKLLRLEADDPKRVEAVTASISDLFDAATADMTNADVLIIAMRVGGWAAGTVAVSMLDKAGQDVAAGDAEESAELPGMILDMVASAAVASLLERYASVIKVARENAHGDIPDLPEWDADAYIDAFIDTFHRLHPES